MEKSYADTPQYNQQYQHNDEPIQFNINNFDIEDKVMSKSSYILGDIISLLGSILGYYLICYCLLMLIVNSYSESEVIF